jgi:hypothetical protein
MRREVSSQAANQRSIQGAASAMAHGAAVGASPEPGGKLELEAQAKVRQAARIG